MLLIAAGSENQILSSGDDGGVGGEKSRKYPEPSGPAKQAICF